MSAAEHQSPNSSSQSEKSPLRKPPKRPSLVKPPSRPAETVQEAPVPVTTPAEQPSSTTVESPPVTEANPSSEEAPKPPPSPHPISLPSEPMQYRAIGLVRGIYTPEEEQLNRGNLIAEDGTKIDSVLLGRVTSLIKKHIDLNESHLWVVYPRTRQADEEREGDAAEVETDLHLQIVGVWEPETLGMPGENPGAGNQDESQTAHEEDSAASTLQAEAESSESSVESAIAPEDAMDPEDAIDEDTVEEDTVDEEVTEEDAVEEEVTEEAYEDEEASVTQVDESLASEADLPTEEFAESDEVMAAHADLELSSEVIDETQIESEPLELPSENYFSIRGEVLKCDEGSSQILVKILQGAKQPNKTQKAFKLHVAGQISGKTVGYFWELDVERQGKQLVLLEGRTIGIVPPKKRKKSKRRGPGGPGGGGRRPSNQGPRRRRNTHQAKEKPRIRPSAPVKSNPL